MQIQCQTGASLSTIRRVRLRQSAEGTPHSSHRPVRLAQLCADVHQTIETAPRGTIRGTVRQFSVSQRTKCRVIRQDLGYYRSCHHAISAGATTKRLERSRELLRRLRGRGQDRGKVLIFSDKKWWTLAQYSNRQNDKVILRQGEGQLAQVPDDVRFNQVHQRAAGTMFLGVVTSDGKVAPPIWVERGMKVNQENYQAILRTKVKPWIDANYPEGQYIFQQDGAPAHTAGATQEFLRQEGFSFWSKEIWLPSSPDLSPLDFAIWDAVAGVVCAKEDVPNLDTLKHRVSTAWRKLDEDFVHPSCRDFIPRLKKVVDAKGGAD